MNKNTWVGIVVITAVSLIALWFLYPSVTFYLQPAAKRREIVIEHPERLKKVLNLGLDLQGGMRLVLEVDRTNLTAKESADVLDRAYAVIENRINGMGVAEPTIQKQGTDRLIIELPGLQDEQVAKQVIGSTAQLEFKLLREPVELDKAIRTIDKVVKGEKDETAADTTDTTAVKDKEAQDQAEKLFTGQDEKAEDATKEGEEGAVTDTDIFAVTSFSENLIALGDQVGVLESNKAKVDAVLARKDVQDALKRAGLGNSQFLWGHSSEKRNNIEYRPLYYLKEKAELRGDIIKDAQWQVAQGGMEAGQAVVHLEMNKMGRGKFARVTGVNVHKFLAIILDNTVYSAPQIREKIPQGMAQITGRFTNDEAKGLAIVLRAGALPATVNIIEERTVGPSLGQDSINKTIWVGILSFIVVFLFMVTYYRMAGLFAVIALVFNVIFLLAIMASFGATLTLPGIAGVILVIGMAVDANVIIYERIREELAIGKTIRSAVEAGYKRAFITVMDSNLTTVITAVILYWVGTGPVKGFAVTMTIGIMVSLFTALYITKKLFDIVTSSRDLKKLSI